MQVSVNLDYKNYIFDLYGTIIDIHTEEGEKKLWKALAKFYRQRGAFYFAGGIRRGYHKYVDAELEKAEETESKVFPDFDGGRRIGCKGLSFLRE